MAHVHSKAPIGQLTNKSLLTLLPMALMLSLWNSPLLADDAEATKTAPPWDIGLTLGVVQSPFLGGKERLSLAPTRLKHSGLRLSGFAWPVYQQPTFTVYLGAGLDDWSHERDDSPQLADMNALDRAINVRAGIAAESKSLAGWISAELAQDLAGAHAGLQAKLRYTTSLGSAQHEVRPYVEAQWLSADLTDYYVGVDSTEVTSGRPQYQADAALALKTGVAYRHRLSEAFTFIGELNVTHYDEAISASPIVANELIWGATVGLTYRWK